MSNKKTKYEDKPLQVSEPTLVKNWHQWFAWYPVRTGLSIFLDLEAHITPKPYRFGEVRWRWFRTIQRRGIFDVDGWVWEYRD